MSFTAVINGQGNFTASVNGSAAFNVSVESSPTLNVGMATIGPSGLLSADAPLVYDSSLKNLSIDLSDYATILYVNEQIANVEVDLTGYATESWVLDKGYITSSALTPYITSATAASTYYPLTNPTGYITSSSLSDYATIEYVDNQIENVEVDLTGYATESFVTGQGYITSAALTPYLLSTTAASTYQPIGSYATTTQLSDGLAGKANTTHTHDASAIVTGTIDIARIPIIPSQVQVVSTQNSIANLTAGEQAQITGAGVLVTTTDGNRWVYSGTGSKTSESSYVKVADITPDWSEIANKPFFGTASGSDITDFAPAGWNPFNQTLNTTDEVAFRKTTLTDGNAGTIVIDPYWLGAGITHTVGGYIAGMSGLNGFSHTDGTNTISIKAGAGITFADATVQTTAYTGATNPFDQSLNTTDNVNFNTVNASGGIGSLVAANDYTSLVGQQIQSYGSSGTLTISADAGITFADATVQTTAAQVFDQSLNTTDTVQFSRLQVLYGDGTGGSITADLGVTNTLSVTDGVSGTTITPSGITFPDATTQTTAYTGATNPFDQSLNTTDSPTFGQVFVGDNIIDALSVTLPNIITDSIQFADTTVQTTAAQVFDQSLNSTDSVQFFGLTLYPNADGGLTAYYFKDSEGLQILSPQGSSSTYYSHNGITFPDSTVQSTAYTGQNIFDQSLNTTDNVSFNYVSAPTVSGFLAADDYSTLTGGTLTMYGAGGLAGTTISSSSITFADATIQTTAYTGQNIFDQSLNTTDSVNFLGVSTADSTKGVFLSKDIFEILDFTQGGPPVGVQISVTGGVNISKTGLGITFPDSTVQTTAAVTPDLSGYATTADLTNGLATKLDEPTIAGLDGQILSTDGINNIWVDNFARTLKTIVRNETGETLLKGTIVYISGASGNKPLVQKAIASTEAGSNRTFGVLEQDIATNHNGEAVAVGQLVNVDTLGLTEGVSLWLSPTTAGTWTTTKPTAPNHAVFIGNVVRAHQTQGVIEVRIQNGYELDELHDVAVLDRESGDILWYDGTTSLWKSNTVSEVLGYTPISRVVEVNDTDAGIRITQTGTGEAFRVEDGTSPDSTAFVINASGNVGIGTNATTSHKLTVSGSSSFTGASFSGLLTLSTSSVLICGNNFFSLDGVSLNQAGSYISFPDNTTQTTAWTGQNIFNQSLNTSDQVEFNWVTASNPLGQSILITPVSITFNDASQQTKAYPFSGAVATAIEGGLLNATAPSASNPFATAIEVESSVNAYAASITPVLPTADEKAALSSADLPSSSNPYLTLSGTPTSSTSQSGLVELATVEESYLGADNSRATTPLGVRNEIIRTIALRKVYGKEGNLTVQSTGTGFSFGQIQNYSNIIGGANVVGFTRGYAININTKPSEANAGHVNFWDSAGFFGQRVYLNNTVSTSGYTMFMRAGTTNSPTAGVAQPVDPPTTEKTVGVKYKYGESIKLQASNGSSYTEVDTGVIPINGRYYNFYVYWDGTGNCGVDIYHPDGTISSTVGTGAPTGNATNATSTSWMIQLSGDGTSTAATNLSSSHPIWGFNW